MSDCSLMRPCGATLPGLPTYGLDGESEFPEDLYGAAPPALEITGRKALARGELVSRAQDCFSADNVVRPKSARKLW